MVDNKENFNMNNNSNFNPYNLDFEDRLRLGTDGMWTKIDKSYVEMLLDYYPDLNQKEMAVCLAICDVIWDLNGNTEYNAVIEYSLKEERRELFVDEKAVEDTIKQLIEKGILKIEYSFTVNKISPICNSPLCPKAFYHLVKFCDFVKEEIRYEAFMIFSNQFSSSIEGAFVPKQPIRRHLKGLPAFVVNRGGEYCFMPGLRALRWLADLDT
jgi:hypothetical protein